MWRCVSVCLSVCLSVWSGEFVCVEGASVSRLISKHSQHSQSYSSKACLRRSTGRQTGRRKRDAIFHERTRNGHPSGI